MASTIEPVAVSGTEVPISATQPTPMTAASNGIALVSTVAAPVVQASAGVLNAASAIANSSAAPLLLLFGGGVFLALTLTRRRR